MAGNNGGPWGGGGNRGNGDEKRPSNDNGSRRPSNEGGQLPEIDELMNKGREQLRVLMGGKGEQTRRIGGGGRGPASGGSFGGKGVVGLVALALVGLWGYASFYTVKPEEQSVELLLGQYSSTGNPGLNFAPWPFVTYDVVNVTSERTESIGASARNEEGLMLTTDANIVDIGFQVVWNISDPAKVLFNIADPQLTVKAVSESVMREIIAASLLAPILNRDRGTIAETARQRVQSILDEYDSGINVIRVNLERADPPAEVIDSFREVQAAEQERDRLQREADAYSNRVMAEARGQAAQVLESSEAYRSRTVNAAEGEASRFNAVREEYAKAPEVTRRRIYMETMQGVLGSSGTLVLDPKIAGGENGALPILPLNELMPKATAPAAAAAEN